jgi:hypothetical protein
LVRVVEGNGPRDLNAEPTVSRRKQVRVSQSASQPARHGMQAPGICVRACLRAMGSGLGATYRLAIFSLSSGWLRPLINLISFAISADMVRKLRREGRLSARDRTTTSFFFLLFLQLQLLAGNRRLRGSDMGVWRCACTRTGGATGSGNVDVGSAGGPRTTVQGETRLV